MAFVAQPYRNRNSPVVSVIDSQDQSFYHVKNAALDLRLGPTAPDVLADELRIAPSKIVTDVRKKDGICEQVTGY